MALTAYVDERKFCNQTKVYSYTHVYINRKKKKTRSIISDRR